MKKLMIAAFAVAFAAVAQAANCNWGTGAMKAVKADGTWDTSKSMYGNYVSILVTTYIYSDSAGTQLVGVGTSSTIIPVGSATGAYYVDGTQTKATLDNSKTYYAKIVMSGDFGNGGTQTFLDNNLYAYTMPGKNNGSVSFASLGAINTSSTTAQWSAVPEPTSGLLLLLGVAGLALKRKRA